MAQEPTETVMAEEATADGRAAAGRLGDAVDVEVERPLRVEVIAIFGPTASGKSAVAEAVADRLGTEVVSADAMQVYRGLPILTNQPARPTRLVGIRALGEEMSVGAFAALAHAEIDEVVRVRGVAVVAGGTGLYLRAALADLEVPPPADPALRRRIEREVDADRTAAHRRLSEVDPASAEAVHLNDRKRLVRALELAETGRSLVTGQERLWSGATRRPTLICGLAVSSDVLERRIRERADAMFEDGVVAEVRAALAEPLSRTAREGARPLRDRAARAAGGARAHRRQDAPLRRLPAEVDETDPRAPLARRRAARRRGGRRDRRAGAAVACRGDALREVACARQRVPRRRAGGCRRAHTRARPAPVRRRDGHRLARGAGDRAARRCARRRGRLEPGRLRGGDVRQRRPDRRTVARHEGGDRRCRRSPRGVGTSTGACSAGRMWRSTSAW